MKILPKQRRKFRIRKKIFGNGEVPRLTIYKSLTSLYAQIINDEEGKTLAASSVRGKKNLESAKKLGEKIYQVAQEAGIKSVVFDRCGRRYHGVIKAFAETTREKGLKF